MELVAPRPPPPSPTPLKAYGTIEGNGEPQGLARSPTKRSYLAIGVLCYLNLVNYMDWFVVPGVLLELQKYFSLEDRSAGLLHTVFVLCFLFSAPLFGYLGDQYKRKIILSAGIALWSGVTLGSSFIPHSMAWLFFITRGLVGAGTASYSTVAPTIIADLFEKDHRTWMLSLFYICIPVGSGLGYITSSGMAQATGHWGWGFRVTPCMGFLGLVLLIVLVPESTHHAAETPKAQERKGIKAWFKDVISLCKNWSFLWSSLGVTAMAFVTGALGFWVPVFLSRAQRLLDLTPLCKRDLCDNSNSRIFGGMTIATGILGVIAGAEAARRYRKINPKADPLICALGSLTSAPCIYLAIILAQESTVATYIFIALAEFLLSLNWAIVADILLYVVKPSCQSTAMSLQILVSHLLGDAGSPSLIGMIAMGIQDKQGDHTYLWEFRSLQYSFVICAFVGVLGGGCFLLTAFRIEEDQKKAAEPPGQGILNFSQSLKALRLALHGGIAW
ncbi:protein spinster homolog 3 isoform X2 [Varanus komodoensis]|uniref:protein spinster homolog 3 isoform X2 n=1 Tax=Varanus komodoensis TaxID=61221 RepID=UPI001CF7B6F5|nr:protein spinster homolog 3 isoform X2 [Varanus komodoensis]